MERTAIILAGGRSERFGTDKGIVKLAGKPLILHVLEKVVDVVDEIVVLVKSSANSPLYSHIIPNYARIITDAENLPNCPLAGALTGLTNSHGEYSILLPCDTPFLSKKVMELLFELLPGVDAVIPRWPNDYIEPLQAAYRTEPALESARIVLERGERRMQSMVASLKRVRYLSTIAIREVDPKLLTFFNINTPLDLKRAEMLIKMRL